MERNPYEVLGVPPGSGAEEIAAAHRRLAQIYHPDRFQAAPADVKAEAERRMKEVNAAFDALRSGSWAVGPPSAREASVTAEQRAYQEAVSYKGPFCLICGHGPVANVTMKEGAGFIIARQVRTVSGDLCRDCGRALFRQAQNGTLLKGWWGLISFFANFVYIVRNLEANSAISELPEPRPTPMSRLTPRSRPLPLGLPLVRRLGIWVTLGLLALVVSAAVSDQSSSGASAPPPSAPVNTSNHVSIGGCGKMAGTYISVTPCTDPLATLRVASVLPSTADPNLSCPRATDYWTRDSEQVSNSDLCEGLPMRRYVALLGAR